MSVPTTEATAPAQDAACLGGSTPGGRRSSASRYPFILRLELPPSQTALVGELRRLGTRRPHLLIYRYGLRDVAAALYYVLSQQGRYQPRNPGGLVTWLVRAYHRRQLQGWQLQRIMGFVRRFRSAPAWVRLRLLLWSQVLHRFWLSCSGWHQLLRRYGAHAVEDALLRHPQADLWRAVRYLLAHCYRPMPDRLEAILGHGASCQGRQDVLAWAREEEFRHSFCRCQRTRG
jgi:hypothetical protein